MTSQPDSCYPYFVSQSFQKTTQQSSYMYDLTASGMNRDNTVLKFRDAYNYLPPSSTKFNQF